MHPNTGRGYGRENGRDGGEGRGRGRGRSEGGRSEGRGSGRGEGGRGRGRGGRSNVFGREGGRGRDGVSGRGEGGRGRGGRNNVFGREGGRGRDGGSGRGGRGRGRGRNESGRSGNSQNAANSIQQFLGSASEDVISYWNNTRHYKQGTNKFTIKDHEIILWRGVWKAAALTTANIQTPEKLFYLFQSLPDIELYYPSLDDVINLIYNTIKQYAHHMKTSNKIQLLPILELYECIIGLISNRILPKIKLLISSGSNHIKINTQNIREQTESLHKIITPTLIILSDIADYSDRAEDLLIGKRLCIREFDQEVAILRGKELVSHADDVMSDESDKEVWMGWQGTCTLSWLMEGDFMDVNPLCNHYADMRVYSETMLRMWVMLTFYWGAGAIWPKCVNRKTKHAGSADGNQEIDICGEPLLTLCHKSTNHIQCRSRNCNNSATWKCHRHDHDHMCSSCLKKHQNKLIGSPSRECSTDIYDALVDREFVRKESSVVFASNLSSRKPPTIAPNWNTTYRLNTAALIGVVLLNVNGEELNCDSVIYWAEVVPTDEFSSNESEKRKSGKISFRFLTRTDCAGLPEESDIRISRGTPIAIIDFRVFVPEVISILGTFAKSSFNGELEAISFADSLIGKYQERLFPIDTTRRASDIILDAINGSNISFINRLDDQTKSNIARKICNLPVVRTLSGTQLDAFASALFHNLHCTQGPPGTGKSYLGICLVHALDLIKTELEKNGTPLGPILILSYKNHALDEFMLDIVSSSPNPKDLLNGKLIRSGNSDNEILKQYSERKLPEEYKASVELQSIINILRRMRNVSQIWKKCSNHLQSSYASQPWYPHPHATSTSSESKSTEMHNSYTTGVILCNLQFIINLVSLLNENKDSTILDLQDIFDDTTIPIDCTNLLDLQDIFDDINAVFQNNSMKNLPGYEIDNDATTAAKDNNLFSELIEIAEHWGHDLDAHAQYLFLLDQFVQGQVPPKRCQFIHNSNNNQCFECVSLESNSSYCSKFHCCLTKDCVNPRINTGRIKYCSTHQCKYDKCEFENVFGSSYCGNHSCPHCKSEGIQCIGGATAPLTCAQHKCKQPNCESLKVFPHEFCNLHCCKSCLQSGISLQCDQALTATFDTCNSHKCVIPSCGNLKLSTDFSACLDHTCHICSDIVSEKDNYNNRFCNDHICSDKSCKNVLENNSACCTLHSCRVCAVQNIYTSYICIDAYPRNVCKDHKLCKRILPDGTCCNDLATSDKMYCVNHVNKIVSKADKNDPIMLPAGDFRQCWGIAKKSKKRCKGIAKDWTIGKKYYCIDHKDQKVDDVDEDSNDEASDDDEGIVYGKAVDNNILTDITMDKITNYEKNVINTKPDTEYVLFQKTNCYTKGCTHSCFANSDIQKWRCPFHEYEVVVEVVPNANEIPARVVEVNNQSKLQSDSTKSIHNKRKKEKFVSNECKADEAELIIEDEIMDKTAYGIPDDELDVVGMLPEEEEENANIQHLLEIGDNPNYHSSSDLEADSGDESSEDSNHDGDNNRYEDVYDEFIDFNVMAELQHASWDMTPMERNQFLCKIIRFCTTVLESVMNLSRSSVDYARMNYVEAKAIAFRKARIVGATVVGASRRLDAIRASEPFAAIVEEACEVMEPALMSVLAVKSLSKLELVGDQRQLPAFVQQCWYNLEITQPSIKTSLFERLILGTSQRAGTRQNNDDKSCPIPFTVLDEQRRMRTEIADLTRCEYEDLVKISDFASTATQNIGDVYIRNEKDKFYIARFQEKRALWVDGGRAVPGIIPCVYFWNIPNNKESRIRLSSCNQVEADSVMALTKWLLLCGCPKTSITIITPYKGQKTTIIDCLRNANLLSRPTPVKTNARQHSNNRGGKPKMIYDDSIVVSTVDRYQGDENDIVILSLVKTNPGNRFVALKNRFIVAASRARLGFFIVGSASAVAKTGNQHSSVQSPSHWQRFIDRLAAASSPTSLLGIGESISVCCPQHRDITKQSITTPKTFPNPSNWNTFCKCICDFKLKRCGHLCSLSCHYPDNNDHNKSCNMKVERPCRYHSTIPLVCKDIIDENGKYNTIDEILENCFQCDIPETSKRIECSHDINLTCHKKQMYIQGRLKPDPCQVPVGNFFHPACNHEFKDLTCDTRRRYEANSPRCLEKVQVKRDCGHLVTIACHEHVSDSQNYLRNPCNHDVNFPRPRCHHILSKRCYVKDKLLSSYFENTSYDIAGQHEGTTIVEFGKQYGPSETFLLPRESILECTKFVHYKRECGHIVKDLKCHEAFNLREDALKKCDELVDSFCCFCQADIRVPCSSLDYITEITGYFSQLLTRNRSGELLFKETTIDDVRQKVADMKIPRSIIDILSKACQANVTVVRACNVEHKEHVTCSNMLNLLLLKSALKICKLPVKKALPCNHSVIITCDQRIKPLPLCNVIVNAEYTYPCEQHTETIKYCHEWCALSEISKPKCHFIVSCQIYRCGHSIQAHCFEKAYIETAQFGRRISNDNQVVCAKSRYCDNDEYNKRCTELVTFQFECGHNRIGVPCKDAFDWVENPSFRPPCEESITVSHPICGHMIDEKCGIVELMRSTYKEWFANPWTDGQSKPVIVEITEGTYHSGVPMIGYYMDEAIDTPAPCPLKGRYECGQSVIVRRKCGHEIEVSCSQAHTNSFGICEELVEICCNNFHTRQVKCNRVEMEKVKPCHVKMQKKCSKCDVNFASADCHIQNVQCNEQVTAPLRCGHMASWICGDDPDPRKLDRLCWLCVQPRWEEQLSNEPTKEDSQSFLDRCNITLHKVLQDQEMPSFNYDNYDNTLLEYFNNHMSSRIGLMKGTVDNLSVSDINNPHIEIKEPPYRIGSLNDVCSYVPVFIELDDGLKQILKSGEKTDSDVMDNIIRKYFESLLDTQYGLGLVFYDLNKENIRQYCRPVNGFVSVVVGMAYRQNMLLDVKPFALKTGPKGMMKANKTSMNYQNSGYDCVQQLNTDMYNGSVVYWSPSIVLPLGIVYDINVARLCIICFESHPKESGYSCAMDHFLCWDCCKVYISSAAQDGAISRSLDKEGNIKCPDTKCTASHKLEDFAIAGQTDIYNLYLDLRMKIKSEQEVNIALENERQKLLKENERIQQIADQNERQAHIIRNDIIDNILTLRCPRCRLAFVDFDGCFALTCGNRTCHAGFCAWCLEDCGTDAHQHVANCNANKNSNKSVHGTFEVFVQHHNQLKTVKINQKLDSVDEYVAFLVFNLIQEDLKGTRINIKTRKSVKQPTNNATAATSEFSAWTIAPSFRNDDLSKYSISNNSVPDKLCRENYEYNQAAAQFTRLLKMAYGNIRLIDVIEYTDNSNVKQNYEKTKHVYINKGKGDETWVFHGTGTAGINGIVSNGFKVGGVDTGVGIKNGAAHGNGVYTAIAPNTPIGYSNDSRCVILARALKGDQNDHKVVGDYAVIFNSGEQLLPCYLVHF